LNTLYKARHFSELLNWLGNFCINLLSSNTKKNITNLKTKLINY